MLKLNVKELKENLLGKEVSFIKLDNFMIENGYYSIFGDGVINDIKESESVVYTALDTHEYEIEIDFEITINNGEDETEESFYLKVTNIEEF